MNLFDSILQSGADKFLWKQTTPQSDFSQNIQFSQAPRTTNYKEPMPQKAQAPNTSKFWIPQANAWEPLVSDDEISKMIKSGATDKEIEMMVTEMEKERSGNKQAPQNIQPTEQPQWLWDKISSWLQYLWEWINNVVWWAITETPKIIGNTASVLNTASQYNPISYIWGQIWDIAKSAVTDKTYAQARNERSQANANLSEQLKSAGQKGKDIYQKYGAYDKNSTGAKVWELWVDIASTIIWPWKIFKTAEWANIAIKTLAGLANSSIEWTAGAVSNYVATEWRLPTKEEVATYIALSGGAKATWKLLEKAKTIPVSKLIPTSITQAGKDFMQWLDVGKAVADTWISFTKNQLVKKIESRISWLGNKIDSVISNTMKANPNTATLFTSLSKNIKQSMVDDPTLLKKLKWTPIDVPEINKSIDNTLTAYKGLFKNKKLTLADQQQLKKDIYSGLESAFNKAPTSSAGISARQATEMKIANTLKTSLEEKVPQIKELNKKLAPFLVADKRLKSKWNYSGYLTDLIAWGIASGNPQWIIEDPAGFMKNFVTWVLLKRVWTSTLAKTTASTILSKAESLFNNKEFQKYIMNEARLQNNNQ